MMKGDSFLDNCEKRRITMKTKRKIRKIFGMGNSHYTNNWKASLVRGSETWTTGQGYTAEKFFNPTHVRSKLVRAQTTLQKLIVPGNTPI